MEIWKTITENKKYEISNLGRVRNKKNKHILRLTKMGGNGKIKHKQGQYYAVNLSKHIYYVHRLVAEHFVNNPNNYKTVDHINMNKENNRAENLQWVTLIQNTKRAKLAGVHHGIKTHTITTKPIIAQSIQQELWFNKAEECARYFDVSKSYINLVASGKHPKGRIIKGYYVQTVGKMKTKIKVKANPVFIKNQQNGWFNIFDTTNDAALAINKSNVWIKNWNGIYNTNNKYYVKII